MAHEFADQIVDSSIGAALLGALELIVVSGEPLEWGSVTPLSTTDQGSVAEACRLAAELPLGSLLELAVCASDSVGSHYDVARAEPVRRLRNERADIAGAIADRSDAESWFRPITTEQWWWTDGTWPPDGRLGDELGLPAGWWCTQPMKSVQTTSPLPDEGHWPTFESLVFGTWDICFGPVARWTVAIDGAARVYEINGPEDWAGLVVQYPQETTDHHGRQQIAADLRVGGYQWQISGPWRRFLTPNWEAVAADWDGVHLTWAGYVTADGSPTVLGDGDVTMLRNWGSERTVWLAPVLGEIRPLPIDPTRIENTREVDSPQGQADLERWRNFAGSPRQRGANND